MATITHLPAVPASLPGMVRANWGDEVVRTIWEQLTDVPAKTALVATWLDLCALEQSLARHTPKTGWSRALGAFPLFGRAHGDASCTATRS